MLRLLLAIVLCLASSGCYSSSTLSDAVVITTPAGRKAVAKKRYSIAQVERALAAPPAENSPFNIQHPVYPTREQLDSLKSQLRQGGTLLYFQGLDSGWAVVRKGRVVCVEVTSHEY